MLVCLYAIAVVALFLLCIVRHEIKAHPSGLGVTMGGIPELQYYSMCYGVPCLLDKWGLP